LVFAMMVSIATAVLVGTIPALRAIKADVVGMIQGRTKEAGGGRVRDGLVALQVGLSLVLVTGAALFARSFLAARAFDLGFDPRNTLVVRADLDVRGYDRDRGRQFVRDAVVRIASLPGVEAASTTATVPFQDEWSTTLRPWPGSSFAAGKTELEVGLNVVMPDYFSVTGIAIVMGRAIDPTDGEGSAPALVVNETLARAAFGTTDVVGRTVPIRGPEGPGFTIVGVAGDASYYAFGESRRAMAYGSTLQLFRPNLAFLVKTSAAPLALAKPVQDALHSLDPDLPLRAVTTLESLYAGELAGYRSSATVIGLAGLIALLLACAGLYGVMAFRVTERTREIGIRMALGATQRRVASAILRRGLWLTGLGLGLGMIGALGLGGLVRSQLYGVPARDPWSLVMAPVILLVVAVAAVLIPARRAMRVDPTGAMRE
jgi:predicted permease